VETRPARQVEPTGVPGLDTVLGGGLARGALALVVGPAGSGKTTLGAQLAFAAARAGRRALILTALSESTGKLIAHLATLDFFDAALLGDAVQVLSLHQLVEGGLARAADDIVATARGQRPALVVLDGYQGVRGAGAGDQDSRRFLYDVAGRLGVLGATVVVTKTGGPGAPDLAAEATASDVVLHLAADLAGVRQRRGLTVAKVRGAAPWPGRHALTLDAAGLTVYPRLEARVAHERTPAVAPPPGAAAVERLPLGLPELDALLGGGLARDSRALLLGRQGTGKTYLGLHFALAGARAGEPTVVLTFREEPAQLQQRADAFGLGAELRAALAPGGSLTVLRLAPVELDPDVLAAQLLAAIDRSGARRLVVDGVAEIERAVAAGGDPHRPDEYLAALAEVLRRRGVTVLFIQDLRGAAGTDADLAEERLAAFAETIVLLRQVAPRGRLRRVLAVLKADVAGPDAAVREFTLEPGAGLRVLAPLTGDVADAADLARGER
jgi:circadian clock protein KaiC